MPVGPRPEPPVDTCRVAVDGTVFGHAYTNVFWLRFTRSGAALLNDLDSVIGSFLAAYNANLVAVMANATAGGQADAAWITAPGNVLAVVKTASFSPSGNTPVNDAAACMLIDWVIGSRYRGGHPRSYLPSVNTAHVVNGSTIDGTALAGINTAVAAFKNAVDALSHGNITAVELGTVRFQSAGAWLTPPVFWPYTSGSCRPEMGTQRRRLD